MMQNHEPRNRRSARRSSSAASASAHHSDPQHGASREQLLRATAGAAVVAAIVLVLAVLPAEYGIDPTGVGRALGLTKMAGQDEGGASGGQVLSAQESAALADTVSKTDVAMRTDSLSVTLQPGEGVEVKVRMRAGERMVFEWVSEGGPVNFDMHGEKPDAGDEFTSYWAEMQKESAAGVFVAPMDGTHGWFWRNRGEGPVTVTVRASGFFEELYQAR